MVRKEGGSLTIVIPALNEEEAIGQTIARCLEARPEICRAASLAEIELIVVSDGSTDRTADIASSFAGARVIEFPQNQGYGAALLEGFRQGRGAELSFSAPRRLACVAVPVPRRESTFADVLLRGSQVPQTYIPAGAHIILRAILSLLENATDISPQDREAG